ncbi:MAG: xanthine dehydrogenase family protein molybdopterin-binding subunit [Gammaproteobacteria bacterium]|nr:xanthine dehydrogenase family protein molybdopterin-binding subunit [Gammaproteobacteria bacterium]
MSSSLGVGAPLRRKEDARHLHGQGTFVADIRLARTKDVAFVRSPVAHGKLLDVEIAPDDRPRVTVASDLLNVKAIYAPSSQPGFKLSEQPVLAKDKVRYVGELVAACVAPTRAEAEDIAERVGVSIAPLDAVADMTKARAPDAALLHEQWGENVFLESVVDADLSPYIDQAAVKVSRTLRTSRQCMSPLEGRAVLAHWDARLDQLVVYTACQMPHVVRAGLAECLGLNQRQVRLIPPDVGGGFGYKGILTPEEVCVCWLAIKLGHPVRWIEDRREQLTANANCREHHYEITGYAAADGTLLALNCEAIVDAGAYSAYPFSACLEAAQVPSILPGPYDFPGYRCRTWCVATNKPAILPYRGVARTGVCFALEVLLDGLARELNMDPVAFRLKNLVSADQMPFDNITNKHFDSGDYPECLRRAAAAIDAPRAKASRDGLNESERVGVGYAIFCEQAAHGTSVYASWGVPMIPGHEQATARLSADGDLELRVGIQSHGQGLETTLAQVANEVIGVHPDQVQVVHGDTGHTPYSTGTWGSRCMVMAGGAVAAACEELGERIKTLGAHLLQVDATECRLQDGFVRGPAGEVSLAEVGKLWYQRPQDLPASVDPHGLEVTQGYKTERDSGTFSYACHACVVAVDTELGSTRILDYVVVEDGGVLVNPLIVEGQVLGGTAQGIGTALYEAMPFDEQGQPLASTLADYHLPGASEMPPIRIEHMETPSPYSRFGQKGIGEGGAIGPPAAIANAINDALAPFKVEVDQLPITGEHILSKLIAANAGGSS